MPEFDSYDQDIDPEYLAYMQEHNKTKLPFYVEDADGNETINPELLKSIEALEFYIIENRVEEGGALINFPIEFSIVKEDLTRHLTREFYIFYEKDKHTQIHLIEIYADTFYAAIEMNREMVELVYEIQQYLILT
jgi:hypothetical protein